MRGILALWSIYSTEMMRIRSCPGQSLQYSSQNRYTCPFTSVREPVPFSALAPFKKGQAPRSCFYKFLLPASAPKSSKICGSWEPVLSRIYRLWLLFHRNRFNDCGSPTLPFTHYQNATGLMHIIL